MFQEVTRDKFADLCRYLTQFFPASLSVYCWLDLRLKFYSGQFGSAGEPPPFTEEFRCFVDRWPDAKIILGVSRTTNRGPYTLYPLLVLWSDQREDHSVIDFLTRINAEWPFIGPGPDSACSFRCVRDFQADGLKKHYERMGKMARVERISYQFWATPENRARVFGKNTGDDDDSDPPPPGYVFDRLRPDDAPTVDETWPHRYEGGLEPLRRRIRLLPSVCLRPVTGSSPRPGSDSGSGSSSLYGVGLSTGPNAGYFDCGCGSASGSVCCSSSGCGFGSGYGRPVSFETVDEELGFLTHLYTEPASRRLGLASHVERQLARLWSGRFGAEPIKYVLAGNRAGLAATEAASDLWSRINAYSIEAFEISNHPSN